MEEIVLVQQEMETVNEEKEPINEEKKIKLRKNILVDKIKLYLSEGRKTKEIAELLDITERTYFNYLKEIRKEYSADPKYDEAIIKIIELQEELLAESLKIYKETKTISEKIQVNYLISKNTKDLRDLYDKFGLIPNSKNYTKGDIANMDKWLDNRHKTVAQRLIDDME
jgi:transposase